MRKRQIRQIKFTEKYGPSEFKQKKALFLSQGSLEPRLGLQDCSDHMIAELHTIAMKYHRQARKEHARTHTLIQRILAYFIR